MPKAFASLTGQALPKALASLMGQALPKALASLMGQALPKALASLMGQALPKALASLMGQALALVLCKQLNAADGCYRPRPLGLTGRLALSVALHRRATSPPVSRALTASLTVSLRISILNQRFPIKSGKSTRKTDRQTAPYIKRFKGPQRGVLFNATPYWSIWNFSIQLRPLSPRLMPSIYSI